MFTQSFADAVAEAIRRVASTGAAMPSAEVTGSSACDVLVVDDDAVGRLTDIGDQRADPRTVE